MRIRTLLAAATGALALSAAPALAQNANGRSIMELAVNQVHVTSWDVYGPGQTNEIIEDANVQGGHAMRVRITGAGANAWDAGAGSLTTKPIKRGDQLVFAVWARVSTPAPNRDTANLVLGLQQSTAPYTPMGVQPIEVTGEWAIYQLKTTAPQDYAAGAANATVQLATGAQTIDLGPVFILDYGPAE